MLRSGMMLALLLWTSSLLMGWTWLLNDTPQQELARQQARWFGQGWDGSAPRRDVMQNHKIHVQDEEIDCTTCHAGAQDEAQAGMPEMSVCEDCHDEVDDTKDDKTGCLKCHTFADPNPACTADECTEASLPEIEVKTLGPKPYRNLRYAEEDQKGGFSHKVHFKAEIACKDCHGDVALEAGIPFPSGKYMPTPQRCADCHAKDLGHFSHVRHQARDIACADCHGEGEYAKDWTEPLPEGAVVPTGRPGETPALCRDCHDPVSKDCQTCHVAGTFAKNVPPPSHRAGWKQFHGPSVALVEKEVHGQDCATCHNQTDCKSCHNTEPPRDHTNFWRTRGHGLMAAGFTDRCENCHKQDFCTSCHNETAPRTHVGNWSATHCTSCHLGSGGTPTTNCKVCHIRVVHPGLSP